MMLLMNTTVACVPGDYTESSSQWLCASGAGLLRTAAAVWANWWQPVGSDRLDGVDRCTSVEGAMSQVTPGSERDAAATVQLHGILLILKSFYTPRL